MFTKANGLAVLALALGATAIPQGNFIPRQTAAPVMRRAETIAPADLAHNHGAVSVGAHAPKPTARTNFVDPNGVPLTVAFVNSFTADLSTVHIDGATASPAISGNTAPGILPVGATDSFAVPTGWFGQVAFVENGGGRAIVGDESLFEGSFVQQDSPNAFIDIDISYVNGFSVPIVCSCDDKGVVAGCNKYLWDLGTCPNDNLVGSCRNPQRNNDTDGAQPDPFFAPCAHAAFTVPRDPGANVNNVCQSGLVTCCIGPACPPNPNFP